MDENMRFPQKPKKEMYLEPPNLLENANWGVREVKRGGCFVYPATELKDDGSEFLAVYYNIGGYGSRNSCAILCGPKPDSFLYELEKCNRKLVFDPIHYIVTRKKLDSILCLNPNCIHD